MKFLLFVVFFIIVGGVTLFFSLLKGIGQLFFGKNTKSSGYQNRTTKTNNSDYTSTISDKKVFKQDEGEYIMYEEIKD